MKYQHFQSPVPYGSSPQIPYCLQMPGVTLISSEVNPTGFFAITGTMRTITGKVHTI